MPAPPRRSTSTASCATTICARRPSWATSRSTSRPRASATAPATTIALDLREQLRGLAVPAGTVGQGGRAAAGTAGAGDAARRDLRPRRRDPPRGGRQGARGLRERALHRRCRRLLRHPRRPPARRHRPGQSRISPGRAGATSTTRSASSIAGTTVGYSHRGGGRQPIPIRLGLRKGDDVVDERALATPVPANALPGERGVVELGDVVRVAARARVLSRSSATTAAPPRW